MEFSTSNIFCGSKKKLFKRGRELVKNQMEINTILMQMNKMRSILSALVENDTSLIDRANKYYLKAFDIDDNDDPPN